METILFNVSDFIHFLIGLVPYAIGGFIVYVVMNKKHNEEMRKATLEAYYKGKEDMERMMLREQLKQVNDTHKGDYHE